VGLLRAEGFGGAMPVGDQKLRVVPDTLHNLVVAERLVADLCVEKKNRLGKNSSTRPSAAAVVAAR
jgi:hypothetical protein